ncbi:hypothetical protein CFBP3846_P200068 (plasmid) [Pseudomonas syringae pv. avii]|uniref:Secreted protein n=1 Tax=Pseudomonas syringae pv. avii TaxID=663959 RepID=A0ABY1UGR4_PSESX|nr:hypothetical protein CFBP3846_P200068 [Pseudomonas syringae pv. avii]
MVMRQSFRTTWLSALRRWLCDVHSYAETHFK